MGLVTAEEFKKARVLAETGVGDKEGGEGEGDESVGGRGDGAARRKKKRKKKKLISTLSFGEEIEEEDGDGENGSGTPAWKCADTFLGKILLWWVTCFVFYVDTFHFFFLVGKRDF